MGKAIRMQITKNDNSQGIHIPKVLVEQSDINTKVEIETNKNHLTISTPPQLRVGWDIFFAAMAAQGGDFLLDDVGATSWEQGEWEW